MSVSRVRSDKECYVRVVITPTGHGLSPCLEVEIQRSRYKAYKLTYVMACLQDTKVIHKCQNELLWNLCSLLDYYYLIDFYSVSIVQSCSRSSATVMCDWNINQVPL